MSGTLLHVKGDGGSFTRSAASNYCRFLREKCLRGGDVCLEHFEKMGCKETAKYRVMRLIDAGEAVTQGEGQGKPRKLTKSQEKKVTY